MEDRKNVSPDRRRAGAAAADARPGRRRPSRPGAAQPVAGRCPLCGAELQLEPACHISEVVYGWSRRDDPGSGARERIRLGRAVLCSGCEYCEELP